MALSKDFTILFGDIRVAVLNTPKCECDPVHVELPEGLYEHNDKVWCLKKALNSLRDASRLFHEHFADVLTSRLGLTRSEAQPTLIAVHVDDLIVVGPSSQLYEVVGEMKQYFTIQKSLFRSLPVPKRRTWVHGTCVVTTPCGSCRQHGVWKAC